MASSAEVGLEREKSQIKLHKISVHLMIFVMVLCFVVSLFVKTEDIKISPSRILCISDGWVNDETDREITDDYLTIKPSENISISRTLPEDMGSDKGIALYDLGLKFYTYVDGESIYTGGTAGNVNTGEEIGAVWRFIPLGEDTCGKEIVIVIENDTDSTLKINMNKMYLCCESDLVYVVRVTSRMSLFINITCLIFAISLMILAISLYRLGKIDFAKRMSALSVLSLSTGTWVFFDGNMTQLITGNGSIKYYTAYMSFILMPLFLTVFYESIFVERVKVLRLVLTTYEIAISLCVILNTINYVHLSETIFLVHAYLFIIIMIIGYFGIRKFMKSRSPSDLGLVLSFFLFVAAFGVGMYYYYTSVRNYVAIYVGAGYLIFIAIVCATQIRVIVKDYRETAKEMEFKRLSSIDGVTGGNSRIVAKDWLKNNDIYEKGNPWFLHMNLNNFASINISHGWENGNEILKGIYNTNQQVINKKELQCSIGNAGFIFILEPDRNVDEFCKMLSEILGYYLGENWKNVHLTAKYSAIRIQKNEPLESMLDHAVIAYSNSIAEFHEEANCYYYNEACNDEIKRRYNMEYQIDKGLENQEFVMYLQPKVEVNTDQTLGAEALIRWNSSYYGRLSPGEFIPLAEETGQIRKMDLYIFRKACEYIVERQKRGLPEIPISVNVAKYGMENAEFFMEYKKIVEETKVPMRLLEFEITESMAYGDMNSVKRVIDNIHETGSKIAMDDFGSAYSNLGLVGNLEFDVIKLDKSLIDKGFPDNKENYTLIKYLIMLFHELNIRIVCEGVEDLKQKEALRELGCDLIQGYFYSKPLTVEEFEAYERQ